jgi:hypothetical protein
VSIKILLFLTFFASCFLSDIHHFTQSLALRQPLNSEKYDLCPVFFFFDFPYAAQFFSLLGSKIAHTISFLEHFSWLLERDSPRER